ncbi:MAG: hypothetical protein WAX89_01815 [Alphaproteobacteria bacterium]
MREQPEIPTPPAPAFGLERVAQFFHSLTEEHVYMLLGWLSVCGIAYISPHTTAQFLVGLWLGVLILPLANRVGIMGTFVLIVLGLVVGGWLVLPGLVKAFTFLATVLPHFQEHLKPFLDVVNTHFKDFLPQLGEGEVTPAQFLKMLDLNAGHGKQVLIISLSLLYKFAGTFMWLVVTLSFTFMYLAYRKYDDEMIEATFTYLLPQPLLGMAQAVVELTIPKARIVLVGLSYMVLLFSSLNTLIAWGMLGYSRTDASVLGLSLGILAIVPGWGVYMAAIGLFFASLFQLGATAGFALLFSVAGLALWWKPLTALLGGKLLGVLETSILTPYFIGRPLAIPATATLFLVMVGLEWQGLSGIFTMLLVLMPLGSAIIGHRRGETAASFRARIAEENAKRMTWWRRLKIALHHLRHPARPWLNPTNLR